MLLFFFFKIKGISLLVSYTYLGINFIYSVLVVASKGVFKFVNNVEVKIYTHNHSEFSFIIKINWLFYCYCF